MDKVLTTVLLTIASLVTAGMLASAMIPTVSRTLGSMAVTSNVITQRIQTDMAVEYIVQNTSTNTLYLWVKNTGSNIIQPVEQMDVILAGNGLYQRITYGNGNGQWQFTLDQSTWLPNSTCSITVSNLTLASGQYTLTLTTPNGIGISKSFNV